MACIHKASRDTGLVTRFWAYGASLGPIRRRLLCSVMMHMALGGDGVARGAPSQVSMSNYHVPGLLAIKVAFWKPLWMI